MGGLADNYFSTFVKHPHRSQHYHAGLLCNSWNILNSLKLQSHEENRERIVAVETRKREIAKRNERINEQTPKNPKREDNIP